MFTDTSRLDFHGSQFTNVLGDMNVTYNREEPSAVREPPTRPLVHLNPPERLYSDSESYCNQLLRHGRGFPLYIPAPRGNLPAEYGYRGVSIGDVGRVTPEGIFDFFFNIYLPADHPINDNDVPENFSPLALYDSKNVLPIEYLPGQHVSTSAVLKVDLELSEGRGDSGEFVFDCLGPRGAVLALPLGSHIERLDNFGDMLQYTRQNAENWYKYVNGARGRQLSNGSLYLITGWEKARAWGIAAFQEIPQTRYPFRISFGSAFVNSGQKYYRWNTSGPTRTKSSGPVPMDQTPLNETVFIHGFSISLGTSIWSRLFGTVEVAPIVDAQLGRSSKEYIPYGAQGFSNSSWGFDSFWGSGGAGLHDSGVTLSDISPAQNLFHPSQVMNTYLLGMFPDATVVMTHDDDWREILRGGHIPSGSSDWDALQLLQRACQGLNAVLEENGLAMFSRSTSRNSPRYSGPPEVLLRDPWRHVQDIGPANVSSPSRWMISHSQTSRKVSATSRPLIARSRRAGATRTRRTYEDHNNFLASSPYLQPGLARYRSKPQPRDLADESEFLFGAGGAGINYDPWMAPNDPTFTTPQPDWWDDLVMASPDLPAFDDAGTSDDPYLPPNPFVSPEPSERDIVALGGGDDALALDQYSLVLPAYLESLQPLDEDAASLAGPVSQDSPPTPAVPHPEKDEDQAPPEEESN
ncbi:hypothetical protein FB45DRAFT_262659 [Roridomyces roridus]|uniref:Uncharacterized protein n=1 Tax=Roridomyces roridus TaxID=1738132 RepID=A0AAD7FBK7_9AGAR|nr:hypothetical protein FB45DRAFT_262659 [Roridomyces roridus]